MCIIRKTRPNPTRSIPSGPTHAPRQVRKAGTRPASAAETRVTGEPQREIRTNSERRRPTAALDELAMFCKFVFVPAEGSSPLDEPRGRARPEPGLRGPRVLRHAHRPFSLSLGNPTTKRAAEVTLVTRHPTCAPRRPGHLSLESRDADVGGPPRERTGLFPGDSNSQPRLVLRASELGREGLYVYARLEVFVLACCVCRSSALLCVSQRVTRPRRTLVSRVLRNRAASKTRRNPHCALPPPHVSLDSLLSRAPPLSPLNRISTPRVRSARTHPALDVPCPHPGPTGRVRRGREAVRRRRGPGEPGGQSTAPPAPSTVRAGRDAATRRLRHVDNRARGPAGPGAWGHCSPPLFSDAAAA